jgi:hypothetical protein
MRTFHGSTFLAPDSISERQLCERNSYPPSNARPLASDATPTGIPAIKWPRDA